jgi:hypothetical protein
LGLDLDLLPPPLLPLAGSIAGAAVFAAELVLTGLLIGLEQSSLLPQALKLIAASENTAIKAVRAIIFFIG